MTREVVRPVDNTSRDSGRGTGAVGMRPELRRKLIHLSAVAVPLVAWVAPPKLTLVLLVTGVALALLAELARARVRLARYLFLRWTRRLLRPRERKGISGATFMIAGYLAVFVLFPRPVAVTAMLYNGVGDAVAAMVGRRWGRHRIGGKSWEGAVAGFAANVGAGALVPGIPLGAALVGGAVAAAIELSPLPLDDNLSVTIGGALGLWVATILV